MSSAPPKTPRTATPPSRYWLAQALRAEILGSGLSAYALGQQAGVDAGVVQRFLNQERDLRLETASKLADVLTLRLVPTAARRAGRPTRRPAKERPTEPAAPETAAEGPTA